MTTNRTWRKSSERAVDAIIDDLTDRHGLRQEWDNIDRKTRAEIRAAWIVLIEKWIPNADSSPIS